MDKRRGFISCDSPRFQEGFRYLNKGGNKVMNTGVYSSKGTGVGLNRGIKGLYSLFLQGGRGLIQGGSLPNKYSIFTFWRGAGGIYGKEVFYAG